MKLEDLIAQDQELVGNGNWLHGAENDSLVVDVKRQLFFWNSRSIAGDKYAWLTKVKGYSHEQAKEFLRQNDGETFYGFVQTIKDTKEVVTYPKLVDVFFEEGLNADRTYWYKRGFTDRTIHRFKLGYCEGWYTIPIYQDGLFRDFQMRRDEPHKMIKHYYRGVGRLLFNSDILRVVDEIYLCEGPTDALSLIQAGLPAVSHNAGSEGWDDDWFKYFIGTKQIYVVYDNDKAGREGVKKVAKNLGIYRTKVYTFDGFDEKFDVGDFFVGGGTKDEFKTLVEERAKYVFE